MRVLDVATTRRRLAPGPRAWPLVGNLGIARGLLHLFDTGWADHGDVFRVHPGGKESIVVCHPDQIHRVLVANRVNYFKGRTWDPARKIFGDGLITLEGETWRQRRDLAQPSFHRHALAKLATNMAVTGARFFDALHVRLGEPLVLDVHREMVQLTMDVVINALFGRGTFESSRVSYETLGDALSIVSEAANGLPLPAWLPTPGNYRLHRTRRELNASVFEVIRAARGQDTEGTLLSMLLAARDEAGRPMPDPVLRDEVLTLFIAGHETTALTMTWLFALLHEQAEVQRRMRAEVDDVLGGRDPEYADVLRLVYLRQVIDETLRLRPPAPLVARDALHEDELGGFYVAPGLAVLPYIWGVHRHPDFWPEPLRFDPERFTASAAKGRHNGSYLPFSIGPRTCIGNAFAVLEATLLTAQLLQRFEVETLPCADVKPIAIGTMRPSRPVHVRFARRKTS